MIRKTIHELAQGFIHALAYVVMTVFMAWLYTPEGLLA